MTQRSPLGSPRNYLAGRKTGRALPSDAREHNRSLVTRVLYHNGPMSRAELSRTTGLAKVTISDLIAQLLEAGYVEELGLQEVSGPGKPAILVDLARDSFLVVAADLSSHTHFSGALLNLDAEVKVRAQVARSSQTGEEALELLFGLLDSLVEQAEKPILGIGIGTPGIVTADGTVKLAQNLRWSDLDLRKKVQDRFSLPVIVGNDANLSALGERLYGDATDDFILVTIGHGIGAGVILGGNLIRGAQDSVGELGVVIVGTTGGFDSNYNPDYTLENHLSVPAIEKEFAGKDEAERQQVLLGAASRLGVALAPLVATLDLSEIILDGPSDVVNDTLTARTRDVVLQRVLPGTHEDLLVRTSSRDGDTVLLGCVAQVLATLLGVS